MWILCYINYISINCFKEEKNYSERKRMAPDILQPIPPHWQRTGPICVCPNLPPPKLSSGTSWHLVQDFKNMPCVFSFVDRSVTPSPMARCHIFTNITISITFAESLTVSARSRETRKCCVWLGLKNKTQKTKCKMCCHNLPVVYP